MHANNVVFLVNLVERIIFDFGEDATEQRRLLEYAEQLPLVIDIIGYLLFSLLCFPEFLKLFTSRRVLAIKSSRIISHHRQRCSAEEGVLE